jgi:hypothetical protein
MKRDPASLYASELEMVVDNDLLIIRYDPQPLDSF